VHRFFAAFDAGDDLVILPKDEAEHLVRVLRLSVGDTVAVFDGRGHECLARVRAAAGRDVRLQLLSRIDPAAESPVAMTLAQAVLKGDKMDDVVRDGAMLGVSAIQPLVTRRTETTVAAVRRGGRVDRWRRVALASVKQSGRAVLPDVRDPLTLDAYLDEPAPVIRVMLVEPSVGARAERVSTLRGVPAPADAALLIGPEGGWDPDECAAAQSRGVRLFTLGHRTLRADAVAVAALSILGFVWDE
jgi:16S rRNA (uracil1498-N3)-methyltransferase